MLKKPLKGKTSTTLKRKGKTLPVIGWREWGELPDLGIAKIKVKIDTGAKTSSLHAFDLLVFRRHGQEFVRFKVHPLQRNTRRVVDCEARLEEWRQVTDSGGKRTLRPVIKTKLMLGLREVLAEVTLIARDQMGFRMLIGRQALRRNWLVDPARSYIAEDQIEVIRHNNTKKNPKEEE